MERGRTVTRDFLCKDTKKYEKGSSVVRTQTFHEVGVQQLRTYHKVCVTHTDDFTSLLDVIEVRHQRAYIKFKSALKTTSHQSARLIFVF